MSYTIGFIGAGNMSGAIIGGMIAKGIAPERIIASNRGREKLDALQSKFGIRVAQDNLEAAQADVVVLSVKPQMMKAVCEALKPGLGHNPLLVTVAAGLEVSSYQRWLGDHIALVRCMPNTPSLVGKGASGLYANANVSAAQRQQVEQLMQSVGITQWVEKESLINAVIAVAGSSPAYCFLIMEAMIEEGVRQGLTHAVAKALTIQALAGAAELAAQSDVEVDELKRRVMSPGGTTEQAIFSLEDDNLREIFSRAMQRCANRADEMAKQMGEQ